LYEKRVHLWQGKPNEYWGVDIRPKRRERGGIIHSEIFKGWVRSTDLL